MGKCKNKKCVLLVTTLFAFKACHLFISANLADPEKNPVFFSIHTQSLSTWSIGHLQICCLKMSNVGQFFPLSDVSSMPQETSGNK